MSYRINNWSALTNSEKDILRVYHSLLSSGNGQLMLEDLEAAFVKPTAIDDDTGRLDHVPPEFRVWIREGERNVVNHLRAIVEAVSNTTSEDKENENG